MNSNVLEELINAQNNNQSAFGNLLPLVPFTYFQSSPLTNFSDDIFMNDIITAVLRDLHTDFVTQSVMDQSMSDTIHNKKDNIELKMSPHTFSNTDNEEKLCTICIEDFEEGNSCIKLKCGHIFHENCISDWVKYNPQCPVCRVEIKVEVTQSTHDNVEFEDILYSDETIECEDCGLLIPQNEFLDHLDACEGEINFDVD